VTDARGFTLAELLLAVTLTATVMASAFAAADLFARADRTAIEHDERAVDVDRALRFLREDVHHAATLTVAPRQVVLERTDGRHVGWIALPASEELHRVDAASLPALTVAMANIVADGPRLFTRDGRGHLPDAAWCDTAVVQGEFTVAFAEVKSSLDAAVIGLRATLAWNTGGVRQQRTATACSLALAETHTKAAN
jgi:hypothetical protein